MRLRTLIAAAVLGVAAPASASASDGYLHQAEATKAAHVYKAAWWSKNDATYHPCTRLSARVFDCKVTLFHVAWPGAGGNDFDVTWMDDVTVAEHPDVTRVTSWSVQIGLDIGRRSVHRWRGYDTMVQGA